MHRLLVSLVLLAACKSEGDDFPIAPGGDDSVISPMIDASVDAPRDGAPGSLIDGRVCVLIDPRNHTSCADSGAAGIGVMLGTSSAVTEEDGAFTIVAPPGSNLVWIVGGGGVATSVMAVGAAHLIPVIDVATQEDLLLDNGVITPADQGQVFVRSLRGGLPLAGVTATVTPPGAPPTFAVRYDGLTPIAWTETATGMFGVAWLPGVPAGTVSVTVTPSDGTPRTLIVPVLGDANTFATVEIP